MEQIVVQSSCVAREEVEAHLNNLNDANHAYKEAEERRCCTFGQVMKRSVDMGKANARFREEHAWLFHAGYPLFTFFKYESDTDSYIWPE